ncbi:MAG: hypothetical protein ACRDWN_04605, partial [Acidimicrobiales bacterium]
MTGTTGSTPVTSGGLDAVADALGRAARRDVPLGPMTTYRVGGPAALLVEVASVGSLRAVRAALTRAGGPVPVLVVGKGSNLLVADAGFPGVVLRVGSALGTVEPGRPGADGRAVVRA